MKLFFFVLFCISIHTTSSQDSYFKYSVSNENPFGKINPKSPKEIQDYKGLIGKCNCISVRRNKNGSWSKPQKMTWNWKYIMNGTAVQDETLKEDGSHSGSIRQYDTKKQQWNVHYYSSAFVSSKLSVWTGNKTKEGKIVLFKNHKSPKGVAGFYRLTFYDISKDGYSWVGEWTDLDEKNVYPTWKISCKR